MGVNKVILLGNLGKDPELRYTAGQTAVCRFSLATGERRKDQSGNWVEHTEWHNVVTFGKTAENCSQYLKKGRQAFVEGRIQTNKWQDKEGKDRYTTEIIASTVQFVGGRDGPSRSRSDEMVEVAGSPEEMSAGQELVASLSSADSLGGSGASKGGAAADTFQDDDIPF